MGVVVEIITPASRETIDALSYLLSEARAGHVVGIAYVAMHKANDLSIDYAGEIRRYPLVAIGATALLSDELLTLVKDRSTAA
jgi:hypothetical protein